MSPVARKGGFAHPSVSREPKVIASVSGWQLSAQWSICLMVALKWGVELTAQKLSLFELERVSRGYMRAKADVEG